MNKIVVTGGGGMERIKKAIRGQVLIWTGDKTKDAEIYERYMVKPDSVSGVELDDIAIGYIIDGISEVFCHAKTLHTKFTRKRNELSTFCYELFLNVNNIEQDTKLTDRIEACLDFISVTDAGWENNQKETSNYFFTVLNTNCNF